MTIGVSLFLIAAGAVLTFAVERDVEGLDLDVVGWVLMAAGALGILLSLLVFEQFTRFRRHPTTVRDDRVVRREIRDY